MDCNLKFIGPPIHGPCGASYRPSENFAISSGHQPFLVEILIDPKAEATKSSAKCLGSVISPSLPQPTRVTPQQLEEKRVKGLCYNCDCKCTKGHKCAEKKLFYIDYEEEEEVLDDKKSKKKKSAREKERESKGVQD